MHYYIGFDLVRSLQNFGCGVLSGLDCYENSTEKKIYSAGFCFAVTASVSASKTQEQQSWLRIPHCELLLVCGNEGERREREGGGNGGR